MERRTKLLKWPEILTKFGLSPHAVLTMVKSALPATILVAAFQSKTWSNHFNVLNYLVAIEGLLAFCVLPRAKFLQTLVLNVLLTCIATAVNLLAIWTGIQARKHTSRPGDGVYNSSQSAVLAVWFAVQIYVTNALRSSRPQFQFPCINYCIVTIIAIVQAGPNFIEMSEARSFMWLDLQAFLTGYAVSAGVSLFILPHSNRDIALETLQKYVTVLSDTLALFHSALKGGDVTPLKTKFDTLTKIHIKLGADLEFAVRDFGYSHLTASDLIECYQRLRKIYLPLLTISNLVDATMEGMQAGEKVDRSEAFMQASAELYSTMSEALLLVRAVLLKPANMSDVEKNSESSLKASVEKLHYCRSREIVQEGMDGLISSAQEQHIRFISSHSSIELVELLAFIQEKLSGPWTKRRLILPDPAVLYEWFWAMFSPPEVSHVALGDHRNSKPMPHAKKNPQHLPPETLIERFGDFVRTVPRILSSPHSLFGLRAMCASMSLAIISYLRVSHLFFVKQRCLWAIVMTAIAMNNSTGQTTFNFGLRILATVAGTIGSLVIWYIADGHTAGVILFMFIYMAGSFYWCVVKPNYAILAIVSAVTPIISVGYALNVRVLPPELLQATNTPKFPIYQVAAYRLINVVAGLAAAYFWSIFPFPVTEGYITRQQISSCTMMLAKYSSMIGTDLPRLEVLHHAQASVARLKVPVWKLSVGGKFPKMQYQEIVALLDSLTTSLAIMGYCSTKKQVESPRWATLVLCLISASIINEHPMPPFLPPTQTIRSEQDMVLFIAETKMLKDLTRLAEVVKELCGDLECSSLSRYRTLSE